MCLPIDEVLDDCLEEIAQTEKYYITSADEEKLLMQEYGVDEETMDKTKTGS